MMRYLIAVSVILAAAGACGVAEAPDESTASPTDAVVEASGMVPLAAADGEKRFILRHPSAPERWNGRLVITAHGGTGGPALAADGTQVGTSETSLDDVVGAYAVEQGFAYASVDRDGIGGTTQGLAVVSEFAEIARERLGQAMGRPPAQVYLVGLSMGGGIARLASEAAETPFDGIVIIAGAGGDAVRGLDRLARRAALWPAIDPHEHPEVDDDDPAVAAYAADGAGTPVDARPLWPYMGASSSLEGLSRSLERYGLSGLSEAELEAFSVARYAEREGFSQRVRAGDTTGAVGVPTIEVVLPEILAYKDKVRSQPGAADRHRLYQVRRAWHISREDDALEGFRYRMSRLGFGTDVQQAAGEYGSYVSAVQRALDLVDRWVVDGVAAPGDQIVDDGGVPGYDNQDMD